MKKILIFLIAALLVSCNSGQSSEIVNTNSSIAISEITSSINSSTGEISSEKISSHSHTYGEKMLFNENYHWREVTCGHDEAIKKERHTFESTIRKPTGTTGGYTKHTCKKCDYYYIDNETDPLTYTITWKNYDGSILETDSNVPYGSIPTYDGSTPSKPSDAEYSYTWNGWSPNVTNVTGNKTYTAQFTNNSVYDIFEVQDGWAIGKYKGNETRVVVPSTINGKTIVEIGEYAFGGNTKLLSVSLPDTILRIGEYAFDSCTRLYEFKNSKKCVSVGARCLAKTSLKEITIPESLTTIGQYWTLSSPIEKVIIEGNRNNTLFIGDYLGSLYSASVSIDNVLNSLDEHFDEIRTDTRFTYVYNGLGTQELPIETRYRYELKDTNRYFKRSMKIIGEIKTVNLFANDDKSSYSCSTNYSSRYEYPDWGTWSFYYYTPYMMSGNFYLSLDTLKTIEISASSNLNTAELLGRLPNVNVGYYD